MIVALAFCHKDEVLAEKLLRWIGELNPELRQHTLILFGSLKSDKDRQIAMVEYAKSLFGEVQSVRQVQPEERPWPLAPNEMFRVVTKFIAKIYKQPFLWMEPDCVPLQSGWLDDLAREYETSGKRFMGCVWDKPRWHMNGNGFYPAGFVYPVISKTPFDVEIAPEVLASAHHSLLMQHIWWTDWGKQIIATFPDAQSLSLLRPEAVFFHRCKDGTLIDRLAEKKSTAPKPVNGVLRRMRDLIPQPWRQRHKPCVVCLGRYGDIMNALPVARHLASKNGGPVPFMVADQFSDILDGVSYATPVKFHLDYSRMPEATAEAAKHFKSVVPLQVYGTAAAAAGSHKPHNRIAWQVAGYGKEWSDPTFRLEFDRRSPVQERILVRRHIKPSAKPILLLSLVGGISSPFEQGPELRGRIEADFGGQYQIVDLSLVRGQHIYDLLGIYEVATALIAQDSAPMHLAAAVAHLPVILLHPPNLYNAAEPRCRCELSIEFSQWGARYPEISHWLKSKAEPPKVWHTFEVHTPLGEREKRAQSTWKMLWDGFHWRPLPFTEPYPRDGREIGDSRAVPYLNDVLANALTHTLPQDIVVFTNSDIGLLPEVHNDILERLSLFPAVCSSRRDVNDFAAVRTQSPVLTHLHTGRDLFAFRSWWLAKYLPKIPPLLIGNNQWDNLLVNLLRKECGMLITGHWGERMAKKITDCEMASPNVLHEKHVAYSDAPANHQHLGNLWNRAKLREWAAINAPEVRFPWLNRELQAVDRGEVRFKPK